MFHNYFCELEQFTWKWRIFSLFHSTMFLPLEAYPLDSILGSQTHKSNLLSLWGASLPISKFTMANSYYTSNLSTLTECVHDVTLWDVPTSPLHSWKQFLTTQAQIGTPTSWLPISILVCKPHISRLENFWGHILETLLSHGPTELCTLLPYLSWMSRGITPIDLIVMTLVCSCVTTECAAKHNHDEVTVWMEQVCSKFSIFVLFKKLAIWLTSLHLPAACLWFCSNKSKRNPKIDVGGGQATRIFLSDLK